MKKKPQIVKRKTQKPKYELVCSEPTNEIVIQNFPPSKGTYAYAQRVIKNTYEKMEGGIKHISVKMEYADPFYFKNMSTDLQFAFIIAGNALHYLDSKLPKFKRWIHEKYAEGLTIAESKKSKKK